MAEPGDRRRAAPAGRRRVRATLTRIAPAVVGAIASAGLLSGCDLLATPAPVPTAPTPTPAPSATPAPAPAAPPPSNPWTALPPPPGQAVGVWTACSHGTRLFLTAGAPGTAPVLATAADPECLGRPSPD